MVRDHYYGVMESSVQSSLLTFGYGRYTTMARIVMMATITATAPTVKPAIEHVMKYEVLSRSILRVYDPTQGIEELG